MFSFRCYYFVTSVLSNTRWWFGDDDSERMCWWYCVYLHSTNFTTGISRFWDDVSCSLFCLVCSCRRVRIIIGSWRLYLVHDSGGAFCDVWNIGKLGSLCFARGLCSDGSRRTLLIRHLHRLLVLDIEAINDPRAREHWFASLFQLPLGRNLCNGVASSKGQSWIRGYGALVCTIVLRLVSRNSLFLKLPMVWTWPWLIYLYLCMD